MPASEPPRTDRARALVMAYGWNATAYQILNPGMVHWFDPASDAVVGYVPTPHGWVAAGAPVCPPERVLAVTAAFADAAGCVGQPVVFFGAEARLRGALREAGGWSAFGLGAQPVWTPAHWAARVESKASLRAQFNRARNKGVCVAEWPSGRAQAHAGLHRCLEDWLASKGLPPLHFLVEPETLARLEDRRVFVAEDARGLLGFVVASPVPARQGWLIEQFVREPHAPNGTTECMLDTTVRALAADGAQYVTFGMAPLSRRAAGAGDAPVWMRLLLGWVRAHGRRFYNFEGLEAFKAKFLPERWDALSAVTNRPRPSFGTLLAISHAFSGRTHPVRLVSTALGRALRDEARTLGGRRPRSLP